jgi:hypothetical protein
MDPVQQRVDDFLPMVARDVGVQVEPETLDAILVRAVRRQPWRRGILMDEESHEGRKRVPRQGHIRGLRTGANRR